MRTKTKLSIIGIRAQTPAIFRKWRFFRKSAANKCCHPKEKLVLWSSKEITLQFSQFLPWEAYLLASKQQKEKSRSKRVFEWSVFISITDIFIDFKLKLIPIDFKILVCDHLTYYE